MRLIKNIKINFCENVISNNKKNKYYYNIKYQSNRLK